MTPEQVETVADETLETIYQRADDVPLPEYRSGLIDASQAFHAELLRQLEDAQ